MRNRVELCKGDEDYALIQCNHKGEHIYCRVSVSDLEMLELLGTDISVCSNGQGKLYARMRVDGQPVFLHRYLLSATSNERVSFEDGDSLNCGRDNLYTGDTKQISRACIVRANKTRAHGTIGVTLVSRTPEGKYLARINSDTGRKYCGIFATQEEAIQARRKAEKSVWGM